MLMQARPKQECRYSFCVVEYSDVSKTTGNGKSISWLFFACHLRSAVGLLVLLTCQMPDCVNACWCFEFDASLCDDGTQYSYLKSKKANSKLRCNADRAKETTQSTIAWTVHSDVTSENRSCLIRVGSHQHGLGLPWLWHKKWSSWKEKHFISHECVVSYYLTSTSYYLAPTPLLSCFVVVKRN